MFDEQQQKLLEYAWNKARRDYKNNCNVYQISAYNQKFDLQLQKLVTHYSFDFEAIALHLYFKFPQFSDKLKPKAVAYRWYQLILARQGKEIKGILEIQSKKQTISSSENYQKIEIEEQDDTQVVHFFDLAQQKMKYQAALKMAAHLDQQQEEGLMVYRPKFIMDSEYKLERQKIEDLQILSTFIESDYAFQFGPFQAPVAAPAQLQLNIPLQMAGAQPIQQEQKYMDDDWQAYESD